jgi:hypothetical protein
MKTMIVGKKTKHTMESLERKGIYDIATVFCAITDQYNNIINGDIIFDGVTVKANSLRYQMFMKYGTTCVHCGLKGQYFALERNTLDKANKIGRYHFNLYGVDSDGYEVLLTKDHIIPKSKGGRDFIDNMQTMCVRCNINKKDTMPDMTYNTYGLEHLGKFINKYNMDIPHFIKCVEIYNNLNDEDKARLESVIKEQHRYKSVVNNAKRNGKKKVE